MGNGVQRDNELYTLGYVQGCLTEYAKGTFDAAAALEQIRTGMERMERANEAGQVAWGKGASDGQ